MKVSFLIVILKIFFYIMKDFNEFRKVKANVSSLVVSLSKKYNLNNGTL